MPAEFTPAERRVLEKLCEGKPNKVIAHELGVVIDTVEKHMRHMMQKTGTRNRVQLVLAHLAPKAE